MIKPSPVREAATPISACRTLHQSGDQRVTGHYRWLRETQEVEQGGGHVGEAAICEMLDRPRRVDDDERHRVQRVCRMRLVRLRVAHHFGIAVIGSDDERAASLLDRLRQPAEAGIYGLDRLDRR